MGSRRECTIMNSIVKDFFRRSTIFKRGLFLGALSIGVTTSSFAFYNRYFKSYNSLLTGDHFKLSKYNNTGKLQRQLIEKKNLKKRKRFKLDANSNPTAVNQYKTCIATKETNSIRDSRPKQSVSAKNKHSVKKEAIDIRDTPSPSTNRRSFPNNPVSHQATSTVESHCQRCQYNVIHWDYAALFQSPVGYYNYETDKRSLKLYKRKQENGEANHLLHSNKCAGKLRPENSKVSDIIQLTADRNTRIILTPIATLTPFAVDISQSYFRSFVQIKGSRSSHKFFLVEDHNLPLSSTVSLKFRAKPFRFFVYTMSGDSLKCVPQPKEKNDTDWNHESVSRYDIVESSLEQMKKDIGSLSSKLKQNPNYLDSTPLTYSLSTDTYNLGEDSVAVASNIKEDLNRLSSRLKSTEFLNDEPLLSNSIAKGSSKESNLSDSGFGSNDALQHDLTSPNDTHYSPMLSESAYSEDEEDFVEDQLLGNSGHRQPVISKNWNSPSDFSGYNPFDKNYPELSDRTRDLLAKIRVGRSPNDTSVSSPPGSPTFDDLELEDISLEDFIINTDDLLTFPMPPVSHGSQFGSMRSLPPIVEEHPGECSSSESESEEVESDAKTGGLSVDEDESEAESFVTVKSVSSTIGDDKPSLINNNTDPKGEISHSKSILIERATFVPGVSNPFDCCESSSESEEEGTPQTSVTHENFRMIMESGSRLIHVDPVDVNLDISFNADQQTEQDLSSPSNSEASWPSSTGTPTEDQETSAFDPKKGEFYEEADREDVTTDKKSNFDDNENSITLSDIEKRRKLIDSSRVLSELKPHELKRVSNDSEESDGIICSSEYDSDSGDEFDAAGAIERQRIRERLRTVDDSVLLTKNQNHHTGIFQPPLPKPISLYRPQQARRKPRLKEKDLTIIEELPDDLDKSEEFQKIRQDESSPILLVGTDANTEDFVDGKHTDQTNGVEKPNLIDSTDLSVQDSFSEIDNSTVEHTSPKPNHNLTHCSKATLRLRNWGVSPPQSVDLVYSKPELEEDISKGSTSVKTLSSHFEIFSTLREKDSNSMALEVNSKDGSFVDSETGEERGYQKTLVPANSSGLAQSRGSVTAVASSRALVKRGGFGNGPGSYPTSQAMVKAEASASSPGIAAARATAKAASIASENASKGGDNDANTDEDIHIYISTSCTIRRNRPAQLEVSSKEDVESGVLLSISRNSYNEDGDVKSPNTVTETVHFEKNGSEERPRENVFSLLRGDDGSSARKSAELRTSLTCELPSPNVSGGRDAVQSAAYTAIKSSFPASDNIAHEISKSVADRVIHETPLIKSTQDLRFAEFRKTLDTLQSRHEDRIQKRSDTLEAANRKGPLAESNLKFDQAPSASSQYIEETHIPSSGSSASGSENWRKPLKISTDNMQHGSSFPRDSDQTTRSKVEYNSVLQTPVDYSQKSTSPQYILSENRLPHKDGHKQKEKRDDFFKTSEPDYNKIDQFSSLPSHGSRKYEKKVQPKTETKLKYKTSTHLKSVPDDDTVRFQSLQTRKGRQRFKSTDIDNAIYQGSIHDLSHPEATTESSYHLQTYDTSPGKYKSMSLFDLTGNNSLHRTPSNPALAFFSDDKSTTALFETDIDTGEVRQKSIVLETNVDTFLDDSHDFRPKTQSMVNLYSTANPQSRMEVFEFEDTALNRAQSMDLLNDQQKPDLQEKNKHGLIERLEEKAKSSSELRVAEALRKIEVPQWLDNASLNEPSYLLESEKDHPDGYDSIPRWNKKPINPPKHPVVIPTRVSLSKSTPSLITDEFKPTRVDLPSKKLKTTPSIRDKLKPIDSKLRNVMSGLQSSPTKTYESHTMPARHSILKSLPSQEDSVKVELNPSDFLPKGQTITTKKITTKYDEVREDILFTRTSKCYTKSDNPPPPDAPESSLKKQNYRSLITVATESLHPNEPVPMPSSPRLRGASSVDSIQFMDDHASASSDAESLISGRHFGKVNGPALRKKFSDVSDSDKQKLNADTGPPLVNVFDTTRRPSVSSRSSIEHEDSDSQEESNKETEVLGQFFKRSEARLLKLRDSFDLATFFKNANYSLTSEKCRANLAPSVTCDDLILESMATGRTNLREFYVDEENITLEQNPNVGVVRLFCGSAVCSKEEVLVKGRSTEFVSCYNCYTYYCSERCRMRDTSRHSLICTFGRSQRMCSQLLKSLTPEQISSFSNFAAANFDIHGRGSIFLAFESYAIAKKFMMGEKNTLIGPPLYLSAEELLKFDATIATPCKNYNTDKSFVLSVVISATSTGHDSRTKFFKHCIVLPLSKPRKNTHSTPTVQQDTVLIKSPSSPTKPVKEMPKLPAKLPPPLPERPPVSKAKPQLPSYNQAVTMTTVTTAPRQLQKVPPPVPIRTSANISVSLVAPTTIPPNPPKPSQKRRSITPSESETESETESESSYTSSSSYESSPPPPKPRTPSAISIGSRQAPPKPTYNGAKISNPPIPQRRQLPTSQPDLHNRESLKSDSNQNDQITSLSSQIVQLPPRPTPISRMHVKNDMYNLSSSQQSVPPPVPPKRSTPPNPASPNTSIASPILPPPAAYANRSNSGHRQAPPQYSSANSSISKEEREVYFARIQRFMRDRGVSLRSQFPQIFDHLIQFVEMGRPFPPVNFSYVDSQLQSNAICTLRPLCDPIIKPSQPIRKRAIETDL